MNTTTKQLLKDFDNLLQALNKAKYYSIAEILKGLKAVFIKEAR